MSVKHPCTACHVVCQKRVDTDGSKLDGDSVHPVRGLVIMAAVLLIIPSTRSPSLYSSVSLSVSISTVSSLPSKIRWVVVVLAWHTPFCLLSLSTSVTPSHPPLLTPSLKSVCPCTHVIQLLIALSLMRHIMESSSVTQLKKTAKAMILSWQLLHIYLNQIISNTLTFCWVALYLLKARTKSHFIYFY